tara:strand:- start:109899 stop:110798 length:900 start_codon:yes stop_codon:yes gene_type:complete
LIDGRNSLVERKLWFVRRDNVVKGPFIQAQITRNILLGRLHPNDELSLDEQKWQQVAMHKELYPDVMQKGPMDSKAIELARIQVDERVADQRLARQNMKEERRQSRERRAIEPDRVLIHRRNRKEIDEASKNSVKRPKMPVLSALLIVITITGLGLMLRSENQHSSSDCGLSPAAKVNWSNCTFLNLNVENEDLEFALLTDAILNESNLLGANLSGADMAYAVITKSDFSYANLENARLIGANLHASDFRYANLKNANFSFADLRNALLAGANLSNARFDNTIWIDGRICKKGSLGACQ